MDLFFLKKNKSAYPFIKEVRVDDNTYYLYTLPGNYDIVCSVPRVFRFFPGYHITFLTFYDRETALQYQTG